MIKEARKLHWSLVGLGSQAEKIAAAIQASKNGRLWGVMSKDGKHAADFAVRHGAKKSFASLIALLKEGGTEAVFVTSPNYEHARQCLSLLKAKIPVFCEKPMALSLVEGRIIKEVVQKNKIKFGVGFHLRQHRLIQEAKKMISSGLLGDLRLIEINWSVGHLGCAKLLPLDKFRQWREEPAKSGGGAIMARGAHLFDLMRFLTGLEIEEVIAYTGASAMGIDQTALGLFKLGNSHAYLATSRLIPQALNMIVIYGSKGRLILRDILQADGAGFLEWTDGAKKISRQSSKEDLYQKEVEAFVRLVRGKDDYFVANVTDGLKSVAVTEAFLQSAQSGKLVLIKT